MFIRMGEETLSKYWVMDANSGIRLRQEIIAIPTKAFISTKKIVDQFLGQVLLNLFRHGEESLA